MLRIFLLPAVVLWAERPEFGVRAAWLVVSPLVVHEYEQENCLPGPCSFTEEAEPRPSFGLSLRLPVTDQFAIRIEPAWQRMTFGYTSTHIDTYVQVTRANRWELPVAAEWRLSEHVRPGLGGVVSYITAAHGFSRLTVPPGFGSAEGYTNNYPLNTLSRRTVGGVLADIEFPFRTGPAVLAPDVRYTRWFSKHFGYRSRLDTLTVGVSLRF